MARFRMFVVYHQRLHPGVFEGLSDENIAQLTFYKVNEAIPFEFGLARARPLALVKEYELPAYQPYYQAVGYNEVSCLLHVLRNRLYEGADYVGQLQYDMLVTDQVMQAWRDEMDAGVRIVADARYGPLPPEALDQVYLREPPFYGFPMAFIADHLCAHVGIDRAQLRDRIAGRHAEGAQMAFTNSFLLRSDLFHEMAVWIEQLAPALDRHTRENPDHVRHKGHLGGIVERAVALYLLFRLEPGERIAPLGVRHAHIPELHRSRFGQQ